MWRWVCVLIGLGVVAALFAGWQKKDPATDAATRFLASLDQDQRSKALKNFTDDYRTNWRFVPASRDGVNLGQLTPPQAELAATLLKKSLSDSGFKKIETIKSLEDVLFELEGGNTGRDKRLYTFTFFGEPSATGHWAWRYEGHHVSLNFTYQNGALISSSPQFFGANPAEVRSGPQKGLRALPREQDLAFALLDSLSSTQLKKAILAEKAPYEIVTGNTRKQSILEDKGLAYTELTKDQQSMLSELLKVHADAQSPAEYKRRMGRVDIKTIVFAWMGATKPGAGHYYRIQGSKFLVEYDNTQNDANHIHTVWRDFDGDFGEDVLAEHYQLSHAGTK